MSTVDTQAARVAYVGAYKAVRVGGGGEWRTCAMRDDEPDRAEACVDESAHHALGPVRNPVL